MYLVPWAVQETIQARLIEEIAAEMKAAVPAPSNRDSGASKRLGARLRTSLTYVVAHRGSERLRVSLTLNSTPSERASPGRTSRPERPGSRGGVF
jgi:hypothetical protein